MKKSKVLFSGLITLSLITFHQTAYGEGGLVFSSTPTIPVALCSNSGKPYYPFIVKNNTSNTTIQLTDINGFSGAIGIDTTAACSNSCQVGNSLAPGNSCQVCLYVDTSIFTFPPTQNLNIYGKTVSTTRNHSKTSAPTPNDLIFLNAKLNVTVADYVSITPSADPVNDYTTYRALNVTASPISPTNVSLGSVVTVISPTGFNLAYCPVGATDCGGHASNCDGVTLAPGGSCTLWFKTITDDGSVTGATGNLTVTIPTTVSSAVCANNRIFSPIYERNLYAGGTFTNVTPSGGSIIRANNIIKWNGTNWSTLANGINTTTPYTNDPLKRGVVNTMIISQPAVGNTTGNRDIIVGGNFQYASAILVNGIAKWNITNNSWENFGSGSSASSSVTCLGFMNFNNSGQITSSLYATGYNSTSFGGVTGGIVGEWKGIWSMLSGGPLYYSAVALDTAPTGDNRFYLGGSFGAWGGLGGMNNTTRWNGGDWDLLGRQSRFGVNGTVYALALDGNDLYVGGNFNKTDTHSVTTYNVYRYNSTASNWTALASGIGGSSNMVAALTYFNNTLYAGGNFSDASGVTVNNIAKWNGTSWSAISATGDPTNKDVYSIAFSPNGDMYVAGNFSQIYKWNGTNWSNLANISSSSVYNNSIQKLLVSPLALTLADNDLSFNTIVDVYADPPSSIMNHLAYKAIKIKNLSSDAKTFQAINAIIPNVLAGKIAYCANGDSSCLYQSTCVAGAALPANASCYIWFKALDSPSLVPAIDDNVGIILSINNPTPYQLYKTLHMTYENDLYVGGNFTSVNLGSSPINARYIAKWDGSNWSNLTGVNFVSGSGIRTLASFNGDLHLGGNFTSNGYSGSSHIATWNGINLFDLKGGLSDQVNALLPFDSTTLYATGAFTPFYIAQWNGINWVGPTGLNNSGYALAAIGSDLYVAGIFTTAGGVTVNRTAKWNGSAWSALGSGVGNYALALAANGNDLYVGGNFTNAGNITVNRTAKWNGSAWSALGSGLTTSSSAVFALDVMGSNLYVGGNFTNAGSVVVNRTAKWNGTNWSALGSGLSNTAYALKVFGNDLYVGGNFTTAGGVTVNRTAKWNGTSWSALGGGVNSDVRAMLVVPSLKINPS